MSRVTKEHKSIYKQQHAARSTHLVGYHRAVPVLLIVQELLLLMMILMSLHQVRTVGHLLLKRLQCATIGARTQHVGGQQLGLPLAHLTVPEIVIANDNTLLLLRLLELLFKQGTRRNQRHCTARRGARGIATVVVCPMRAAARLASGMRKPDAPRTFVGRSCCSCRCRLAAALLVPAVVDQEVRVVRRVARKQPSLDAVAQASQGLGSNMSSWMQYVSTLSMVFYCPHTALLRLRCTWTPP